MIPSHLWNLIWWSLLVLAICRTFEFTKIILMKYHCLFDSLGLLFWGFTWIKWLFIPVSRVILRTTLRNCSFRRILIVVVYTCNTCYFIFFCNFLIYFFIYLFFFFFSMLFFCFLKGIQIIREIDNEFKAIVSDNQYTNTCENNLNESS